MKNIYRIFLTVLLTFIAFTACSQTIILEPTGVLHNEYDSFARQLRQDLRANGFKINEKFLDIMSQADIYFVKSPDVMEVYPVFPGLFYKMMIGKGDDIIIQGGGVATSLNIFIDPIYYSIMHIYVSNSITEEDLKSIEEKYDIMINRRNIVKDKGARYGATIMRKSEIQDFWVNLDGIYTLAEMAAPNTYIYFKNLNDKFVNTIVSCVNKNIKISSNDENTKN
jgi:hypothetical protein